MKDLIFYAGQNAGRETVVFMARIIDTPILCLPIFFSNSFRTLIAVATTISFITAPVVAWLIHKAMNSAEVPMQLRPAPGLRRYSLVCIYLLAGFALYYLFLLATT